MRAERQAAAAAVARDWPEGVCHFCGVTAEQVDGDRIRWLGQRRTVCSQPGCVRRLWLAVDQEERRTHQARRKRTPADIHQLKLAEAKARRRASRRKGKAA